PPDNITREAQGEFDELFPGLRTEPLKLVVSNAQGSSLAQITSQANEAPGLIEKFAPEGASKDGVIVFKAGLVDRNDSKPAIEHLRSIDVPEGSTVMVTGTPAIEQDSIAALIDNLPLMAVLVMFVVTLLMFLTFGSLVLPIKAVLMTTLGLGATMGILTWIFIEGNGASFMNFTPGPIMAPVLVLIISIVFGLSTDYEVFLLSRMVEARERGASTSEAIRVGTSHTGRIITAAALILIVVTGAFAFSDLVMMKYIAYGMIAALVIDATLIRMFLVPAVMKLLGDDCWWAPQWMKRVQQKIGLGETVLDDELLPADVPELAMAGTAPAPVPAVTPVRPGPVRNEPLTEPIPIVAPTGVGPIRATHAAKENERRSVTGKPAQAPEESALGERPTPAARPEPVVAPTPLRPRPTAPREPARSREHRESTPDPRSIESWLADLRAPTPTSRTERTSSELSSEQPETQRWQADANSDPTATSEGTTPEPRDDAYSAGSSARNGYSNGQRNVYGNGDRNGSDRNGSGRTNYGAGNGAPVNGSNGSSSNGSNVNGSNSNGTGATSNGAARQPYGTASGQAPRATTSGATEGRAGDSPRTGGVRGYAQSAPSDRDTGAGNNGTGNNGTGTSAGNNGTGTSAGNNGTGTGAGNNGTGGNGRSRDASSTPRARYDISTRNAPRASEPESSESRDQRPTPPESEPPKSRSSRRAAEAAPADGSDPGTDSGRHRGGDGRRALSVSELLARERRE
ncbi:MAG: MMPL family transporter, partial [Rhodococcus sp. (in: high G+C Gram-positive bacteria)]